MRLMRELTPFFLVGGVAFVVSACSLALLTRAGVSPYIAQFPSLALAVLTTWVGNRRWTFRVEGPPTLAEFGRYVAASLGGLVVNSTCFSMLTYSGVPPLPAFAAATMVAMGFNFLCYKFAVFGRR